MGIFSGLFKSRDKPQNRTSGSNYAFFFGGTTSGKAVTERSAMLSQDCHCTYINTRTAAAKQWRSTIRSTTCSTMSQTRK